LGELYYADGFNICMSNSEITLLSAESETEAEKLLERFKNRLGEVIITPQEFVKEMLVKENEDWEVAAYLQGCYTNKVPLHVAYKEIRTADNGEIVAYNGEKIIGRGRVSGDGSMECLWIDEEYRDGELMESLLAYIINKQIFEMQTPYIHISQTDEQLLKLINDMGLYLAEKPIWKLTKSTKK